LEAGDKTVIPAIIAGSPLKCICLRNYFLALNPGFIKMRRTKQFLLAILSVFLLSVYPISAQTLPTMPTGGPDNGTYDKAGRYPAGSVSTVNFYSPVAGKNVDMLIYTPPGYTTSQKYGVIFCYQGIGDKATSIFNGSWVSAGIVCDNLIGEGKISKGVIIVAVDDQFAGNYSNVQDMTIRDAIPYIDSHYSTYADADHRGIFGYSWGGGYTFNVGCKNLDYFHYLSPSSAAPNKEGDNTLFPNGGAYAKQVMKCLFISWGQYDYQSIIDANVATVNYCTNNGIPKYSWVAQGQGHSGGTWRPAIWNFLQLADRAGISRSNSCTSTPITPYLQVNGGTWQQTGAVTVASGTKVVLGPQPATGGTWSWNGGCGTSGTSREQTIYPTGNCDVVATYTNACGSQSTYIYQIRMSCAPTPIVPYIQVNGGTWQQTGTVRVASGTKVVLGPQPNSGGSWSWNGGCGTSGTSREQTIYPTGDCDILATYTNSCGAQSTYIFQMRMSSTRLSSDAVNDISGIRVYPNPSNGTFMINGVRDGNLKIFNFNGGLMYVEDIKGPTEICPGIASGIYLLKVEEKGMIRTKKLIINR
jgi:enterochelin esterase-like enzyme